MVAINEILLPECTGEECGGDSDICMASRVHHRNAENRAPVTRNHRSAPILGRWLTREPIGYQGGINLYGYVGSSPVENVDAEGFSHVRTVVDRVSLLGVDVINVYVTVKYSFKALSAHVRHVRITGLSVTGQIYGVNPGWGVRADATAFVAEVKDHCPCGEKRPEVWVDLHLYKVYFLVTVAFAHGLLPVAEGPCK